MAFQRCPDTYILTSAFGTGSGQLHEAYCSYTMESPRLRRGGARLRLAVYGARLRLAGLAVTRSQK